MKAKELKRDNYTVQVGYSKEAKKKKLVKFISKSGDEFVISAEELANMLIGGVNSETLEATFVDSEKINVVEVGRQLEAVLDRDMKKGEKIRMNYTHPYPLEFALIEQSWGIAQIKKDVPMIEISEDYIAKVMKQLKPEQENFIKKFYKSFKNVDLKNNEKN